jgi:hypothetical protein
VKFELTAIMREQFVVTHTVLKVEISVSLDRWVANKLSTKILCPQKIAISYIFVKN